MSADKLKNYLRNATTVGELIAELSKYPENAPVTFGYTANDYWKTDVAEKIMSVEPANVKWSAYHDKLEVLDDELTDEVELGEQVIMIK